MMSSTEKPKNRRKKHTKSKYGCLQCKSKGTKCDELLPVCGRCSTKDIRCSYLDLSKDQIQTIRIAHWELAGSDPATCPIPPQSFNPEKVVIVEQGNIIPKVRRSWNSNKEYDNNVFYQQPYQQPEPLEPLEEWPVLSNKGESFLDSSLAAASSFEIKLVPHNIKPPVFDPRKNLEFFGETLPVTYTRSLVHLVEYDNIAVAFRKILDFYGFLLQGIAPMIHRIPGINSYYLKYKGLCMNYVLKTLKNVDDSNAETVLTVITSLSSSSIYQEHSTFKDHFTLALGPASLMIEAFSNPHKFPKSLKRLKTHAGGLLFTAKYIFMPQYKPTILLEFYEILKQFRESFINEETCNQDVIQQCNSLIDFIDYCMKLFEKEKSQDEIAKYPIKKIFELLQRWYTIIPSQCYTLSSNTPNIEKVFYVFWFALISQLEAIIIGSRYIFTYFLHGYMLLYPFNKDALSQDIKDPTLIWYFNYSCRIIAFFSRRQAYILRNTVLQNPIPLFSNEKDRFRPRALEIQERYITTFTDTLIKKINYPMESFRSLNLQHADLKTKSGNHYGAYPPITSDEDAGEALMDLIDLSGEGPEFIDDQNPVDLVNNVNPRTSLLNNDFDPRYTDPLFNEILVFKEADLDFMKRYYEDRKLILHLDEGFI